MGGGRLAAAEDALETVPVGGGGAMVDLGSLAGGGSGGAAEAGAPAGGGSGGAGPAPAFGTVKVTPCFAGGACVSNPSPATPNVRKLDQHT